MQYSASEIADLTLAMRAVINVIKDRYVAMVALIDKEHDLIAKHDLDAVEQIAADKLALAQDVDAEFMKLRSHSLRLRDVHDTNLEVTTKEVGTLSQCFQMLDRLLQTNKNEAGSALFAEELAALKDDFEDFLEVKSASKKLLELNKTVLSKMLVNRQENYRFWQEVASDTMSAYNEGGKQHAKHRQSIVNVKA